MLKSKIVFHQLAVSHFGCSFTLALYPQAGEFLERQSVTPTSAFRLSPCEVQRECCHEWLASRDPFRSESQHSQHSDDIDYSAVVNSACLSGATARHIDQFLQQSPLDISLSGDMTEQTPERPQINGQLSGAHQFTEALPVNEVINIQQRCEIPSCEYHYDPSKAGDQVNQGRKERFENEKLGRFSFKSIQPDTLNVFTTKFGTRMDNLLVKWRRCRTKNDKQFGDLPIVETSGQTRVINASTGKYIGNRDLLKRIKKLITWLIFTNTVILRRFTPDTNLESEMKSHQELIDWLIKLTFEPESGVPVMGIIMLENFTASEQVLQRSQVYMAQILSGGIFDRLTISMASSLISIWYKDFNPTVSSQFEKGSERETRDYLMDVVILDAIKQSKIELRKELDNFESKDRVDFKELSLIEIKRFPKKVIPQRNWQDMSLFSLKETKILEKMEGIQSLMNKATNKVPLKFQGIPVQLLSPLISPQTKLIRIANKFHQKIPSTKIVERVKGLFNYALLCHAILVGHFSKGEFSFIGREKSELNFHHQEFLAWLEDQFFQPDNGSLPIFGQVGLDMNEELTDSILTSSRFGEVQILLIDYLSDVAAHEKLPQICTALLEYWYRKHNQFEWLNFFVDHNPFDEELMLGLMKANIDLFGDFQMKGFKRYSNPSWDKRMAKRTKFK
ncbi:hypothetical protein MJO29_010787 [Puccinia striiformis f. sp. tritici]|nr:hypothetical protein MJO29_010787 [Puccinia striiformis f. sp. tritici]